MTKSARHRMYSAAFAAAGSLLGCATPETYAPLANGGPFGYRDAPSSDGGYTLLVVAPTGQRAHEVWNQRAAELCNGGAYRKNIFRAEIPIVTQSGYVPSAYGGAYGGGSYTEDVRGAPILEGYLHCDSNQPSTETPESAPPLAQDESVAN